VSELRVGPFQYVPLKNFNAEQLYIHIFECYQNGHMKRKAKELAEKLKDEDSGKGMLILFYLQIIFIVLKRSFICWIGE